MQVLLKQDGNIEIQKEAIEKLFAKPGETTLELVVTEEGVLIKRDMHAFINSLAGKYRTEGGTMQDFLDLKQEDKDLEDKKWDLLFGK